MVFLILALITGGGIAAGNIAAGGQSSRLAHAAAAIRAWGARSPSRLGQIARNQLVDLPVLLLFGALVIIGVWAFFDLLEDVIMGDGVIGLDRTVYTWLQQHRSALGDRLLVGVTELGDAKVALPVAAVALALFAMLGRWRDALFLAAALGGAVAFVAGLKRVIHRARPVDIYDGVAEYSFPSGHAAMSIVLFGFLAFLLAVRAAPGWRRIIYSAAIVLVLLIGFSRVYLGAHWLSDVLAGLAFGVAWNAALAIAYLRQLPDRDAPPLPVAALAGGIGLALMLAGGVHMFRDYAAELQRYTPPASVKR
jgi:membrane-associated phospholipid phosphatase